MQLFSEEVEDRKELKQKLESNRNIVDDYEVAVIVYAFDKDNKIIFQRRGEADIEIEEFIIATYAKTFDVRYSKEQNWIYLVYKGSLKRGELQIAEPSKNLGYERYQIGKVPENQLSKGAKELYTIVKEKYS